MPFPAIDGEALCHQEGKGRRRWNPSQLLPQFCGPHMKENLSLESQGMKLISQVRSLVCPDQSLTPEGAGSASRGHRATMGVQPEWCRETMHGRGKQAPTAPLVLMMDLCVCSLCTHLCASHAPDLSCLGTGKCIILIAATLSQTRA